MSYQRVIPRDLFNEANLLKCYGKLWILLEGRPKITFELDTTPEHCFIVEQNPADGSLSIDNLPLYIRGAKYHLFRPLNSRMPWPLYVTDYFTYKEIPVFTDEGELTDDFLKLLEP